MTEHFANLASSTLNGAILIGATTLVVASATSFPSGPQFRIRIESELLLVTGVSGTTFTVTRGVEGTTAAPHADTTPVVHILTAAGLAQTIADALPSPRFTPIDANTFLHVSLDEAVGSSTFANDGTFGGTLTPSSPPPTVGYQGIFGSCIQGDGVTRAYVSGLTGAIGPAASAALTVSCWVLLFSWNGFNYQQFVVKQYRNDNTWVAPFQTCGIGLNNTNDGRFSVSVAHGPDGSGALQTVTPVAPYVIPFGVWTFLAMTYDGTHLSAYFNGVLALSSNTSGNVDWNITVPGPWAIGAVVSTGAGANGSPLLGLVDDVRAEGVIRSAAYLAAMYNRGIGLS